MYVPLIKVQGRGKRLVNFVKQEPGKPDRTVKEEQEEISRNHIPTIIIVPVLRHTTTSFHNVANLNHEWLSNSTCSAHARVLGLPPHLIVTPRTRVEKLESCIFSYLDRTIACDHHVSDIQEEEEQESVSLNDGSELRN